MALVTKEQAMRADEGVRARRLHPTTSREDIANNYLLAHGFTRCGNCGSTMSAMNRVQRKRRPDGALHVYHYRNYQCSGDGCNHKQIAAPVEAWVWKRVTELLANPTLFWEQLERHWRQHVTPTVTRVEAFTARLQEIAEESANLTRSLARMRAKGQRGAQYIEAELARLGDEEAETQRRLTVAEAQHANCMAARESLMKALAGAPTEITTIAEKRLVVYALGIPVTMYRPGNNGRAKGENAIPTARCWILKAEPLKGEMASDTNFV